MAYDLKGKNITIVFEAALLSLSLISYTFVWLYRTSIVASPLLVLSLIYTLVISFGIIFFLVLILDLYGMHTKNVDGAREAINVIRLFGYPIIVIVLLNAVGINVTSLLVGAGFLGIVVGLAAQATLANLFAGFSILYSKPFRVGEKISVSTPQYTVQSPSYPHNALEVEITGTVRAIGMMHTRLLRDDVTLVYIPNSIMNQGLITNYSRAPDRMIVLRGEIERSTDIKLAKKEIIKAFSAKEFKSVRDLKVSTANLSTTNDAGIKVTAMILQTEYEKTRELMAQEFVSVLRKVEGRRSH
jgi:small-conductance mechanosensitive channel